MPEHYGRATSTEDILRRLFTFLGDVVSLNLSPSPYRDESQECLVEFEDAVAATMAMLLTGTDLGDRMLLVTNCENKAVPHGAPLIRPAVSAGVAALAAVPVRPPFYLNQSRVFNIPQAAVLDPSKAEEISRTIYAGNITGMVTEKELTEFFAACGPIAYLKMAGDPNIGARFAFIEFVATPEGALQALQLNGYLLGDRQLKYVRLPHKLILTSITRVNPSKNAINKAPKRLDDATMRKMREVESRIGGRSSETNSENGVNHENGRQGFAVQEAGGVDAEGNVAGEAAGARAGGGGAEGAEAVGVKEGADVEAAKVKGVEAEGAQASLTDLKGGTAQVAVAEAAGVEATEEFQSVDTE
ncbi:Protein srek1IP1 [Irineochytrium annulatum]|nr:Protein srek1IP1 [Irineochytrium annulatum]